MVMNTAATTASGATTPEIQYSYGSYPESTPQRMHTLARIFGCNAIDYKSASVLELGCAQGNNIIPLAVKYPQASFVGVDISSAQVAIGQKIITDLGLTNIQLECRNITEIDSEFGKFSYLIANDVFSAVGDEVRQKIFSIVKQNTVADGLAYISYKVLPGWNFTKILRELMLFNVRKENDVKKRLEQAKKVLKLFGERLKGHNHYYANFVQMEVNNILQLSDGRLSLEYLGKISNPMYVFEFLQQASKHELVYLSDALIYNNHFRNSIPFSREEIEQVLHANNYTEMMQYSDFLLNRQYRRTILCHAEQKINRQVMPDTMQNMHVRAFGKITINNMTVAGISAHGDNSYNNQQNTEQHEVDEKFIKIAEELNRQKGNTISYQNLFKQSIKDITERPIFDKLLLRLYHDGYVDVSSEVGLYTTKVSAKPVATKLARYYAAHFDFVITQLHETTKLTLIERFVLQRLDGTKSLDNVAAELLQAAKANPSRFKETIKDSNVEQFCRDAVEKLASTANLVG